MNEDEKREFEEEENSFEEIFASLRNKYHLSPMGEDENAADENVPSVSSVEDDTELKAYFDEKEKNVAELDAFWDEEDDEDIKADETRAPENITSPEPENSDPAQPAVQEMEDVYSNSSDEPAEYEDISSGQEDDEPISLHFVKNPPAETAEIPDTFEDISSGTPDDDDDIPEKINVIEDISSSGFEGFPANTQEAAPEQAAENPENTFKQNLARETPVSAEPPFAQPGEDEPDKKKKKKKKKKKTGIFPKKGDSAGEVTRKLVLIISVLAFLFSAGWLVNDYIIQPMLVDKVNNEISGLLIDSSTGETVSNFDDLTEEDQKVTFESLASMNKDFIGWLTVGGGNVSLPVVYGSDNDKYLKTGFKGSYLYSGTVFIDYRNTRQLTDRNTIIYGHAMNNGSMFGSLKNYKNIDVYKQNPLIYFHTIYGTYIYKIFGAYVTNAKPEQNNGYVFNYTFRNLESDEKFLSYIDEVNKRSLYSTPVDVQAGDRIVTLSTCDHSIKNGRFVIVGRLLRDGESTSVEVSSAKANSSPVYPQVWYDTNKKSNPYKDITKWYPE